MFVGSFRGWGEGLSVARFMAGGNIHLQFDTLDAALSPGLLLHPPGNLMLVSQTNTSHH